MARDDVSPQKLAAEIGMSYQTVKNVLDGNSVSGKFIVQISTFFKLKDRSEVREVLMSFTRLHLEHDPQGKELLRIAGFLDDSEEST